MDEVLEEFRLNYLKRSLTEFSKYLKELIDDEYPAYVYVAKARKLYTNVRQSRPLINQDNEEIMSKHAELLERVKSMYSDSKFVLGDEIIMRRDHAIRYDCNICMHQYTEKKMKKLSCDHMICKRCGQSIRICPYRCGKTN